MNEDNRVIAEFMGLELSVFDDSPKNFSSLKHYKNELKYHSSWEWLMPVVEKIEKIFDEHDGYYGVYISSNSCSIEGTLLHKALKDSAYGAVYYNQVVLEDKLSSTYQAVVMFIKWYNAKQK